MLRTKRQDDRVLSRRGLQLEVEGAAEALAQRQSPGAVDAAAERRVQHQLHPACFIEEPLEHQDLLGGDGTEDLPCRGEILDNRARARLVDPDRVHQPLYRCCRIIQPVGHILAQPGDFFRQLVGAAGRLADPERQRRRLAFGIGHAHLP